MKKLLLLLLMAVATSGNIWAQKGMQGVGVNVAGVLFDGDNFSLGGGIKYQYNISDYFRIEPSISYTAPFDKEGMKLSGLLNLNAFVLSPRVVRPYVIAGAGYAMVRLYYGSGHYDDIDIAMLNGGIGLDARLTHNLSLQAEAALGLSLSQKVDELFFRFNLGLCYNF